MMSIMGCSGEELGSILESLGFRREKRPVKRPAPDASEKTPAANDNVEQASELNGGQEPSAPEIDAEVQAPEAESEAALTPEASEEESGAAASPITAVETTAVEITGAEDGATGAASSTEPGPVASDAATPQAAPAAENAEPEFEEIWRFRRPKPRFDRSEGQGERRHHRRPGGERGHGPHHDRGQQPTAGAAGEQRQPQAERPKDQASTGPREQRHEQGHGRGSHQDRHRHRHDGDRNRDRARQPAPQPGENQAAKAETGEQRAAGSSHQHRKPQPNRNERPHDRNRDTRSSRPQGKQPIAASASPKRASGAVDPDSPFAALSQLKERLEKQLQTQD
jgi:ATP-dependent RNA helicase SUPV3L1/SUV3